MYMYIYYIYIIYNIYILYMYIYKKKPTTSTPVNTHIGSMP